MFHNFPDSYGTSYREKNTHLIFPNDICEMAHLSQYAYGFKEYQNKSFGHLTNTYLYLTLPTADILSGKNARAWVSMVSYLKK